MAVFRQSSGAHGNYWKRVRAHRSAVEQYLHALFLVTEEGLGFLFGKIAEEKLLKKKERHLR